MSPPAPADDAPLHTDTAPLSLADESPDRTDTSPLPPPPPPLLLLVSPEPQQMWATWFAQIVALPP